MMSVCFVGVCQFGYSWDQRFFQRQTALTSADTRTAQHKHKQRLISVRARGHLGTSLCMEGRKRTCKQNSPTPHVQVTSVCNVHRMSTLCDIVKFIALKSRLRTLRLNILLSGTVDFGCLKITQTLKHYTTTSYSIRIRELILKISPSYINSSVTLMRNNLFLQCHNMLEKTHWNTYTQFHSSDLGLCMDSMLQHVPSAQVNPKHYSQCISENV